jgi:hypothetical protein
MRIRILTFAAVLMILPLSLKADTVYSYTGNNFNTFTSPHMGTGPNEYYSTANSVSGSFIVDSPLAANLSNAFINPLEYSFTDGTTTFSASSPFFPAGFEISTDANGNIVNWEIGIQTPGAATDQYAIYTYNELQNIYDRGMVQIGFNSFTGEVTEDPGTWTEAPIPEPGSLILVGTGLFGAVEALRRKVRR